MWERALRRAALPVASTEGFSPRPKVHFGLALSTSHESLGEYLDVDFREPVEVGTIPDLLTPLLPVGMTVMAAAEISRSVMSLQESVTTCTWRIEVPGAERENIVGDVARLLDAEALPVTRQRKGREVTDDVRPGIASVIVLDVDERVMPGEFTIPAGPVLEAELATHPRSLRPAELLAAFDPPLAEGRVCRIHQWIALDGARHEPLVSDATSPAPTMSTGAPHAEVRAS